VITEGNRLETSRQLWLSVCAARGTSVPDPMHVREFLRTLDANVRIALDRILSACLSGTEQAQDMEVVSWAAACTRPHYLSNLHALGLNCTGASLFSAGVSLMAANWVMSRRIAQLRSCPADVESLRAALALQPTHGQPSAVQAPLAPPAPVMPARRSSGEKSSAVPVHQPEPQPRARPAMPQEPERVATPVEHRQHSSSLSAPDTRLQLKLFGSEAAHTLEIGPHRRSADFLGAQVVTVESARALQGGGYEWRRKLTIQLTPEEMPAAIAVLMGLTSRVQFAQHGADHDKFFELRRQEGGMMLVTGQKSFTYAVPVKSALLYYLLDLFCRAVVMGGGSTVADVLALARASQGS
jgi:hypothetical protein